MRRINFILLLIILISAFLMVFQYSNFRPYSHNTNEFNYNEIKVKKTAKEDTSGIAFEIHRNRNNSITETVIKVLKYKESYNTTPSTETVTERPKNKYRIDTKGCKMSNWPLFDEETKKLYKNMTQESLKCESSEPTIEIQRVNGTWIQLNWTKLDKKPFCYISELRLGANDNSLLFGEISGPIESLMYLPDYDAVKVFCYKNPVDFEYTNDFSENGIVTKYELIHEQIIPLIPELEHIEPVEPIPNILLLAIDSVSYLNFERHFPLTGQFVRNHNFFELKGYNSVGVNTWPNMIPFFTGFFPQELVKEEIRGKIFFDNWPIIWKKFGAKGFRTLFTEEMAIFGLFNYEKKGFRYKPVDYYFRPFSRSIQTDLYSKYCYNGKLESEHHFDYFYDFANVMKKRKEKYFAYISISVLSHDDFNKCAYLDRPTHELMSKLFEGDLMDDTVIFFFSDHGIRIGDIRLTHSGGIEARLPFMFIHLPKSSLNEFRDNLTINQNRLITHFDIHSTFEHILNGKPDYSAPHGQSLFEEISEDRDCPKASIPEHFCSCHEIIKINNLETVKPITTTVVDRINSLTESLRNNCVSFELDSIHAAYERIISKPEDENFVITGVKTYLIQVLVKPGKALFESTVKSFDNKRYEIIGDISRINRYGNQSHCIHNSFLERYCYCNDLL